MSAPQLRHRRRGSVLPSTASSGGAARPGYLGCRAIPGGRHSSSSRSTCSEGKHAPHRPRLTAPLPHGPRTAPRLGEGRSGAAGDFPALEGGKGGPAAAVLPGGRSCLSSPPPGNRCGRGSALCAGAGEARAVRAPTAVTLFALAVNSLRVPPPSPSPHS